jgi:peptidyl-prolyl cis-trans isomerase B (cyclophilin B)
VRPATPRLLAAIVLALASWALAACGGDESSEPAVEGPCEEASTPAGKEVDLDPPPPKPSAPKLTVVVDTTCGTFEIALDTKRNPKTASSFAHMAENGVYDNTAFYRIAVSPPIIQGGDPTATGTGDAGYEVDEPPPPDTAYTRGVVAMAKSGAAPPGRSGSQFFIVTAADAGLPPDYAVAGRVVKGFNVVTTISQYGDPSGQTEEALAPVNVKSMTVEER